MISTLYFRSSVLPFIYKINLDIEVRLSFTEWLNQVKLKQEHKTVNVVWRMPSEEVGCSGVLKFVCGKP